MTLIFLPFGLNSFSVFIRLQDMIHIPASFVQVYPDSISPYTSAVLSPVSVLGSSLDALDQDAKKSRLAPCTWGPKAWGV